VSIFCHEKGVQLFAKNGDFKENHLPRFMMLNMQTDNSYTVYAPFGDQEGQMFYSLVKKSKVVNRSSLHEKKCVCWKMKS
jgi:hypothetical protein